MVTPKQRQQLFKDLGLKHMEENEFSVGCLPLSQLKLSVSNYDHRLTAKYGQYIKKHYVTPCALKWVSDQVGYGFFAECTLKPGDYIIEFTGKIIESFKLSKKNWSWGYRRVNDIGDFPHSTCVDSTHGGNEAGFINHSETSNNVSTQKVFFENSWHQIYVATKAIKKGEQFLINYGYWSKKQHLKINL